MRVRRARAFALVMVLVGVAAVFAASLAGLSLARLSVVEATSLRERDAARAAAGAALRRVVVGIVPRDEPASAGSPAGDGERAAAGGFDEPERDPGIELPEFLKELIPELRDVEERGREEVERRVPAGVRVREAARERRPDAFERLGRVGLPARPVRVETGGYAFDVTLHDAVGTLSLNGATEPQLHRYLRAVGLDERDARRVTDQVLDWRDPDSAVRAFGVERAGHAERGVVCRDGPFAAFEELLYLPAITPTLAARMARELTLAPAGPIHAPSAPEAVLVGAGLAPDAARAIVEARRAGALSEAALDRLLPTDSLGSRSAGDAPRFTTELSGVIRAEIDAYKVLPEGGRRPVGRFVAEAFVGDDRVRTSDVRLREVF